jgi:hypothetical protein
MFFSYLYLIPCLLMDNKNEQFLQILYLTVHTYSKVQWYWENMAHKVAH